MWSKTLIDLVWHDGAFGENAMEDNDFKDLKVSLAKSLSKKESVKKESQKEIALKKSNANELPEKSQSQLTAPNEAENNA